jgi:hypothetical protein
LGELTATTRPATQNELIWFIQHPWPGLDPDERIYPKKVGYYQDDVGNEDDYCRVNQVDETYKRSAPASQVAYACDASIGSAGSPIVAAASPNYVVALHHFRDVDDTWC